MRRGVSGVHLLSRSPGPWQSERGFFHSDGSSGFRCAISSRQRQKEKAPDLTIRGLRSRLPTGLGMGDGGMPGWLALNMGSGCSVRHPRRSRRGWTFLVA